MVGEIVAFRVLLPDGDWLYLEGEVRHHRHGKDLAFSLSISNEEQTRTFRVCCKSREKPARKLLRFQPTWLRMNNCPV